MFMRRCGQKLIEFVFLALLVRKKQRSNLVFTNRNGGILSYRTVYDCLKRIVKKMGCPKLRFHDLRHSYAVAAIRAGDDMNTIFSNLGHATISITMDIYASFTDDMAKASASRMNDYICANF